jgi:hypothetical protein
MLKANLKFRKVPLRDRCSLRFDITDLKILGTQNRKAGAADRVIVEARGVVEADVGIMHLRRSAQHGQILYGSIHCLVEGQPVSLHGKYRVEIEDIARDGATLNVHLNSVSEARLLS